MQNKEPIDMMSLGYDICVCCGAVIPEGRQVCYKCEHNDDKDFQVKKKQTLERLYGYDVTEWDGIEVSPGYTEKEGREALKELLYEIRERAEKSVSQK